MLEISRRHSVMLHESCIPSFEIERATMNCHDQRGPSRASLHGLRSEVELRKPRVKYLSVLQPFLQYASRLGLLLALLPSVKQCSKYGGDLACAVDRFELDLAGAAPEVGPHGLGKRLMTAKQIGSAEQDEGSKFCLSKDDRNALRRIFKEVATNFADGFTSEDMLNHAMERLRNASRSDAPSLKRLHGAVDAAARPRLYYRVDEKLCTERASAMNCYDDRKSICPVMKPGEARTWLVRVHWAVQRIVRALAAMGCSDTEYKEIGTAKRAGTRVLTHQMLIEPRLHSCSQHTQ
jgi:hypothetical protein